MNVETMPEISDEKIIQTPDSKSLFEQVKDVVFKFNSYKVKETVSTVQFKNKDEPTEVLTQAEFIAACSTGKSAGNFEPVVVIINPKAELKTLIFNDLEIKDSNYLSKFLKKFNEACELATGFKISEETKSYSSFNAVPAKKEKSAFTKAIAAINAKLYKAEINDTAEKVAKIKLERVQLYIKEGIIPRASFKDLDLFNQVKNAENAEVINPPNN
jgi:hypothetical protein